MVEQRQRGIFDRAQLSHTQLLTVADRRLGDARYLCDSGQNARANGAMYLGGFVIELCLKAELLRAYAWLRNAGSPDGRTAEDRRLWKLCYRSHDLDEILARLPGVQARLRALDQGGVLGFWDRLREVCATWTIFARYSPRTATIQEAARFLDTVRELKKCLA